MEPLALTRWECLDQATHQRAFSLLIPKGWRASGGLQWTPDNLMQMVTAGFTAVDPSGSVRLDIIPNRAFCGAQGAPEGSGHLGMEVRAPMDPPRYLLDYVLPRVRPGLTGVSVLAQAPLDNPRWPPPADQPVAARRAGSVTCEYDLGEVRVREELEVAIAYDSQLLPSGFGFQPTPVWFALPTVSVSAPAEDFDGLTGILGAMRETLRVEHAWERAVTARGQQVTQQMQAEQQASFALQQQAHQMQQRTHEMQREAMRTMQEAGEIHTSGWEERQRIYDRISEQTSYAIRGVNPYTDPASNAPVELPVGYEGVWSNGRGEYVLTEDPTFDPNVGYPTDDTWYPLERADTGD